MIFYNFIFIIVKYFFGICLWMGLNFKKMYINLGKNCLKLREKIFYFVFVVMKIVLFIYY